jgi:hypothetical protein
LLTKSHDAGEGLVDLDALELRAAMIQLKVNGTEQLFNGEPEMPLLWYLRDVLGG